MSKLSNLFNNNRFLMVLSFVLAVIIWFVVSIVYSPQADRTLSQIPVEVSFSDAEAGYKAYSKTELVAQVNVSGKKYVVEQLSADSIVVSATVESVSTSGMYTLELQAKKKSSSGDYTIVSISPPAINVMIDVEKETEFEVGIDCAGASVAQLKTENESLLLEPSFVDEKNMVVTAVGPETEVGKIAYITVMAEVNKELSASEQFTAGIMAYDQSGNILYDANHAVSQLNYVTFSYEQAEIIANVNMRKIVPLTYTASGAPNNPPAITLREITGSETDTDNQVSTVSIKGAAEVISGIDKITLDGTVDFSKIDTTQPMSYRFELKLPSIAGVTYDEYANLSDLYFVAMVDDEGLTSRSFDVAAENITLSGVPGGFTAKVQSALKGVTVVGPRSAINDLSKEDLTVTVDASSITAAGASNLVPVISVKGTSRCWITGSYQVVVEAVAGK